MQLARTTISLPDTLLQEMKLRAVKQRTTFSGFIRKMAEKEIKPVNKKKKKLSINFGKYSIGITSKLRRDEIYDDYLKHKVPA